MKAKQLISTGAVLMALALAPLHGAENTLAIGPITPTDALRDDLAAKGELKSLMRVVDSLETQLTDTLHNTRKFAIVARNDLDSILEETDLAESGIVDPTDPNRAQFGKVAGVKYMLVAKVDNYQDLRERAYFKELDETLVRREFQLSVSARIYDTTTGRLLETATFQIEEGDVHERFNFTHLQGDLSNELITEISSQMATRIAARLTDTVYPAKVISKVGQQVIINRGDGTGIREGQIWEIYAAAEELVDPDTGEVLGVAEVPVGSAKVTRVNPKFSALTVVEDRGIEKLQVARLRNIR